MQNSLQYRPDIDGLRAVAILLVVGYHAFPGVIPGGFVGVDVFFVISGYLISSILTADINSGRFSLYNFFAGRIRRLFPALIVVLCFALIVGWCVLLPHQFRAFGRDLLSSAFFVPNFAFLREVGYFAPAAGTLPLLHLWSLGIEEQFYLLFPLLALILVPLGPRRWTAVVLLMIMTSLILSLFWTAYRPAQAFYLPVFRAWELLAGVALSSVLPGAVEPKRLSHAPDVIVVAGLCLIIICAFSYSPSEPYPGWRAVLPAAGAAMCIRAGARALVVGRLLSSSASVTVGKVSYPLYLWHWPLLVFVSIVGRDTGAINAALMTVALGLAFATYRWVELPIRRLGLRRAASLLTVGMALVSACGFLAYAGHLKPVASDREVQRLSDAAVDYVETYEVLPKLRFGRSVFVKAGEGPVRTLMIGDSNMEQYYPRVAALIESGAVKGAVVFATVGGCPPIPSIESPAEPHCAAFVKDAFAFAGQSPELRAVAVSAAWYGYFGGSVAYRVVGRDGPVRLSEPAGMDVAIDGLESELGALKQAGKAVYLLLNIPFGAEFEPMTRVRRNAFGVPFVAPPTSAKREAMVSRSGIIRARLSSMAEKLGVTVIDPFDGVCGPNICAAVDGQGRPMYKDAGHLRAAAVRSHATFIDQIVLNPSMALRR